MNAIELISAGIGAIGAAGIVWAIAHGAPQPKPQPVEPPNGDDWQWDAPYTQRTETDSSFLDGASDYRRSVDSGLTESLRDFENRISDRHYRTARIARQNHQNTGDHQ